MDRRDLHDPLERLLDRRRLADDAGDQPQSPPLDEPPADQRDLDDVHRLRERLVEPEPASRFRGGLSRRVGQADDRQAVELLGLTCQPVRALLLEAAGQDEEHRIGHVGDRLGRRQQLDAIALPLKGLLQPNRRFQVLGRDEDGLSHRANRDARCPYRGAAGRRGRGAARAPPGHRGPRSCSPAD